MTAASTTVAAPVRRTLPVMRGLLMVFAALTALAVGALFVLADNTSETFAWTIQPPITAAFLGAGYAAGFVLVALSLRDPVWAHNRVPVLTIFVFVVLTLVGQASLWAAIAADMGASLLVIFNGLRLLNASRQRAVEA